MASPPVVPQLGQDPEGAARCPLCEAARLALERDDRDRLVAAFPDRFPVSPGHTLVVPLRRVGDFLDLTEAEMRATLTLVRHRVAALRDELVPDGFNIGNNIGAAAGQTIDHAHVHVIPR